MIGSVRKLFIVSGLILSFGLAMSSQAIALEQNLTASVEVWENVSTNLWDRGDTGINFGQLVPGSVNQPEEGQNGVGAVGLEVLIDTNVNVRFSTSANDFESDNDVLPVSNVKWAAVNGPDESVSLSAEPAIIAEVPVDSTQDVWYWMSVPEDQGPGTYGTSFYFATESVRPGG